MPCGWSGLPALRLAEECQGWAPVRAEGRVDIEGGTHPSAGMLLVPPLAADLSLTARHHRRGTGCPPAPSPCSAPAAQSRDTAFFFDTLSSTFSPPSPQLPPSPPKGREQAVNEEC